MMKPIKRIWNSVTSVLVTLMLLLAALLWGPGLTGMDVFVVQSGSMEPDYPVGSLVYVRETDASALEVGDVITFRLTGDTRATHRIVEIRQEDGVTRFQTKGDANQEADGFITAEKIIGKVVLCIPYLGFLVAYIQQPPGIYIAIAAVAVLLLLIVLPELIFDERKPKK